MLLKLTKKIYDYFLEKKKARFLNMLISRGLFIGKGVDIVDTFFFDPSHCYLISIGKNSTICPNVRLIAHDASIKKHIGCTKIGKIDIQENCFIGDSAIILPNVTIGPNSIIGAGAVVTKTIPPDTVAAGNPAKVIYSLDKYLKKNEFNKKGKRIFKKAYWADRANSLRRDEILEYLNDGIGFID